MMISVHELLADHQMFHSDVQMDSFITIRAGGTLYGQYKQALRELSKRYRGLSGLYHDREMTQVELEEHEAMVASSTDKLEKRRSDIEASRKRFALENTDHTIRDTEREFRRFYAQAVVLRRALEKAYGTLTDETRYRLDCEMWEYNMRQTVALDITSHGRVSSSAITMLRSWPNRAFADQVLAAIVTNTPESLGGLVQFLTAKQPPQLPKWDGELEDIDVKGLLEAGG